MNALSELQKQDGERNNKGDPRSDNDSSLTAKTILKR